MLHSYAINAVSYENNTNSRSLKTGIWYIGCAKMAINSDYAYTSNLMVPVKGSRGS